MRRSPHRRSGSEPMRSVVRALVPGGEVGPGPWIFQGRTRRSGRPTADRIPPSPSAGRGPPPGRAGGRNILLFLGMGPGASPSDLSRLWISRRFRAGYLVRSRLPWPPAALKIDRSPRIEDRIGPTASFDLCQTSPRRSGRKGRQISDSHLGLSILASWWSHRRREFRQFRDTSVPTLESIMCQNENRPGIARPVCHPPARRRGVDRCMIEVGAIRT